MEGVTRMKIVIYTTPTCGPCKMVKKLYDLKGIEYTTKEAQVNEYEELAKVYGTNGPLVYNTETKEGITGYDIPKLLKVAGL